MFIKGHTYSVAQLAGANLDMNGSHTRTFRWILGTVDSSDYTPLAKTASTSAKMSAFSVEDEPADFRLKTSTQNTGGKFGLPPQ